MSLEVQLQLSRDNFELAIDTTIASHGITAIYGHSGAGKTTLLRWIAGLEKNIKGHLQFNKQSWQTADHFIATQQRAIAYVFQEPRLFPHLNVQENLAYAQQRQFKPNGPTMAQVVERLALEKHLEKNCTELSGGEQQRVAIARALLSNPQLLLMDEPLSSLDQHSKALILSFLLEYQQLYQIPILYVSHSIEEVSQLAADLIILEQGKIIAQDSLLSLCSRLDLSINHEENAASIINATVHKHDHHYQLTELFIGETQPLFLTQIKTDIGSELRVRIPARDVSISLVKVEDSSILNIIPATIDAIEQTDSARVLIRLKVADQFLLARLTKKSVDRLQLQTGKSIYAQIKTVALLNHLV